MGGQRALGRHTTAKLLNDNIVACQKCLRLRAHCQSIGQSKRLAYRASEYWARPVPNLGEFPARLLIVGLAPGAHGANRTGRMFTGDRSGQWLFRALHRAGFCNQATWENSQDGLRLIDCAITAVCHCAPPDNKPTTDEVEKCSDFLLETFRLCRPCVVMCLGQLAWNRAYRQMQSSENKFGAKRKFAHGSQIELEDGRQLLASYHPSQQNTFTGRLTETMLDEVFATARRLVDQFALAKP